MKIAALGQSNVNFALLDSLGLHRDLFLNNEIGAKEVKFGNNTILYQSGDPCSAFLIVISGTIRVTMTSKSGREITLYRIRENQTCIMTTSVLLNRESYYAKATTESKVMAIAISDQHFYKALVASKEFSTYILKDYATRIALLIKLIDNVASKDMNNKLSEYLLNNADSIGLLIATQEAIARDLGTAREVISRKLSLLEQENLVVTSRGRIQIVDPKHLRIE